MPIRSKILLILMATWLIILLTIYFGSRTTLISSYLTIDDYLFITALLGIVFAMLMWFLLKIFLLDRLVSVNKQLIEISSTSEFSRRLELSGRDEITSIIYSINTMLEIIELTQKQLKYRLFQRSDELEQLSTLNRNLLTEIEQHKNVESQLLTQEQELRHRVYSDIVTDLPNRLFFQEFLTSILQKDPELKRRFTILFLDIDDFKKINDTYGHEIGDKFLKHFSEQLKNNLREDDLVARLAGDEFIIYLNTVNKNTIKIMCERIIQRTSQPIMIDGVVVQSSTSIGISLYPEHGTTLTDLQREADLAMYSAKKLGGNTFFYYEKSE